MPPLYIVLAVSALLVATGWLTPHHKLDKWAVVPQVLFFQNYAIFTRHTEGLPITGIWSLSVEEHFYLLFPLAYVLALGKLPRKRAASACLLMCALVLIIRLASVATNSFQHNYQFTHTRADSILFGCCLALWRNPALDGNDSWRPSRWQAWMALLAIGVSLVVRNEQFRESLRYTIQGCSLFVLFAFALHSRGMVRSILTSRSLRLIGLYPYTIYLVHVPVIMVLQQHLTIGPIFRGVTAFLISILFAACMYTLIERPLAKLRRRLHHEAGASASSLASKSRPHTAFPQSEVPVQL